MMAEVSTGQVVNGVIVLDEGTTPIPEGTRVRIERATPETADAEEALGALSRHFQAIAGKAKGLPSDLAAQHDHYLHGQPKR